MTARSSASCRLTSLIVRPVLTQSKAKQSKAKQSKAKQSTTPPSGDNPLQLPLKSDSNLATRSANRGFWLKGEVTGITGDFAVIKPNNRQCEKFEAKCGKFVATVLGESRELKKGDPVYYVAPIKRGQETPECIFVDDFQTPVTVRILGKVTKAVSADNDTCLNIEPVDEKERPFYKASWFGSIVKGLKEKDLVIYTIHSWRLLAYNSSGGYSENERAMLPEPPIPYVKSV